MKQNNLERIQISKPVVKASKLPEGEIEADLSTQDLDRHGEKVSIKGIDIPKDQVIKMYYNHQTYGDALPIGKWDKIWKSGGVLKGRGVFDLEDPFAVKVYKKVKNGFIDSISIGFYPQEFDGESSTWTRSTLVEASVVAEPANVNARITSKALDFTEEEFTHAIKVKLKGNNDLFVGEPGTPSKEEVSSNAPHKEVPPIPEETVIAEGDTDTEVKSLIDELNSRVRALEELKAPDEKRSEKKQLIKIRVAAKQVDKASNELNKVLRIKLKETN